MALFTNTYVNKVDRKGRVSVPASFRNELDRQSFHGIAVYPSIDGSESLTGCEEDVLRQWSDTYRADDPFDTDSARKRRRLFSAVQRLPLDADGRVLLPGDLLAHAGITTHAAFVGMGHEFQIWNPAAYEASENTGPEQPTDNVVEPDSSPAPGGER